MTMSTKANVPIACTSFIEVGTLSVLIPPRRNQLQAVNFPNAYARANSCCISQVTGSPA
jgi:hypothetical protein